MNKWSAVVILAIAQFVMILDSTVMNVSISAIVEDLDTTVNALQGAITFFTLTMAALMLIGAKLGTKWGLLRTFVIGSVIYGIGSLITGLSPNIAILTTGWSIIEGTGAVLVIPAIAALVAVNYKGRDRVTAFAIIGGVSGIAAAAGPLIGGFMTTYLSWRYVFFAETAIMIYLLIASRKLSSPPPKPSLKIDTPSALLSASGLFLLVFGMLQSRTWGWIHPIEVPQIGGIDIAPFGISVVAYAILIGIVLLVLFYNRQAYLESSKRQPLLRVSMLSIPRLRSGLFVLMAQYVVTAAIFFIVPIYLQMVIGLDALTTGIRIVPLSIGLILCSIIGTRLIDYLSLRQVVRIGQLLLSFGALFLLSALRPELTGAAFSVGMLCVGSGLGLLASQLGNINMSSVGEKDSSEVGGLQGTFQNLGSSFGTALIGSILIASLSTTFISNITSSSLPGSLKEYIVNNAAGGMQIVPATAVETYAIDRGIPEENAREISDSYLDAQMNGLRQSLFVLFALSVLSTFLSRNIPDVRPRSRKET